MGLRQQQWQQIVRSMKPLTRLKRWMTAEYPYQWPPEQTDTPGGFQALQASLGDSPQRRTLPKDGNDLTLPRSGVPVSTDGLSELETRLLGTILESVSPQERSTCRSEEMMRPTCETPTSYPNLLPTGPHSLQESLRHWTVQWTLHLQSPVTVQRALEHHEMLLNPLPEETLFLSVLNQMIAEQPKQGDSHDA